MNICQHKGEVLGIFWKLTHEHFCLGAVHSPVSMCPNTELGTLPIPTPLLRQGLLFPEMAPATSCGPGQHTVLAHRLRCLDVMV